MRRLIVEEPMSQAAVWSRRLAIFAVAVAAVAVLVTRFRIVDAPTGLVVFGSAILLACVALLLAGAAAVVIWRTGRRGLARLLTAVVLACGLLAWPAWLAAQAVRLPAISDVSTDIDDPPQFSISQAAAEARGGRNPFWRSPAERQAQRAAYPGAQPILLEMEGEEAYQLVLKAVHALDWKIIDQSPVGGRAGYGHIDAVARTLIMGFPNDITVRIKPLGGQTKVDIRAVSRYGRSDFGVNARLIERLAEEIQNQLDEK